MPNSSYFRGLSAWHLLILCMHPSQPYQSFQQPALLGAGPPALQQHSSAHLPLSLGLPSKMALLRPMLAHNLDPLAACPHACPTAAVVHEAAAAAMADMLDGESAEERAAKVAAAKEAKMRKVIT
jgi:hypothetical protein